ncbi:sigma factor-like helix-turn-helix DNA-binding protein [Vallitalea sp.]|jgi:DNA-directed RNA polymerase specialized sigma subunit|uniref:sigma factor-like helix-turn-helix DNA-binding protein n=1 Tax=Vallitalea sp. TaxID=1882829 RepID=UPI0025EF70C7|nr:hypothetical protein [Vallitalea sp.]MCT4686069.1 hypothetical protein [Vallitalea sp.]
MPNKNNQGRLEKIADMAAERAVKKYQDQEKKRKKDYRFRNTKLLLRNYNSLSEHLVNAKVNIKEVNDIINTEKDYYDKDELYIESVRQSKTRTLIMLANIDAAMSQLEENMTDRGQIEKYQVIKLIYIHNCSFEDVARQLNCGHMTVRRWEKEAINELSILLFGIDGMKFDK